MAKAAVRAGRSEREARAVLRARLEARRGEIEAVALTRVNAIADSSEAADPAYAQGLREAVTAALDFGLAAVDRSGERHPPIPVALRAQARIAARSGIGLDTILRRYLAGYSLLGYFILEEAGKDRLMSGAELQRMLGVHAGLFDRLLQEVSEEHVREREAQAASSGHRLTERIERLLAGELVDTSDISYDFEGWHLGAIVVGRCAAERLAELARSLDLRLLLISRGDGRTAWAWFGAARRPDPEAVRELAGLHGDDYVALAIGEPASGLGGWRLTHRQAAAALFVAHHGGENLIRYADVVLLASIFRDDLLVTSLRQLYLKPLESERDGGAALRETLRAYLATSGSYSSAAEVLDVSRRTVSNRLARVEELIDRPLHTVIADIDTALRLEQLVPIATTSPIGSSASV